MKAKTKKAKTELALSKAKAEYKAHVRKTGKTIIVKVLKTKKVKESIKADRHRTALPAGVRISKEGNKYTETRSNRSDKKGSKI